MYNRVKNPETNRWVNVNSILGNKIIKNYLNMTGGAKKIKPCSNFKRNKCPKNRCEWGNEGAKQNRCYDPEKIKKKTSKIAAPVGVATSVKDVAAKAKSSHPEKASALDHAQSEPERDITGKTDRVDPPQTHEVSYLTHLLTEGYFNDISNELYQKDYDDVTPVPIPFENITKIIPKDMLNQYDDENVGLPGNDFQIYADDSAEWYSDYPKFKENDVVIDRSAQIKQEEGYSRSGVDAFLVVKNNGKLCLLMFPMSTGLDPPGFSDGDTVNDEGFMIHPKTKTLVKII